MKRFLITTALEETWVDGEPVLFLGNWCRLYSRRERWSGMDAEVVPWHWDDQTQLAADYQYLSGLYERILAATASTLNCLHDVAHPLRYWRILIGPWLGYFLHILLDRWRSIDRASTMFEISRTIIVRQGEEQFVANDMNEFLGQITGDEWNHHIYGKLLEEGTSVQILQQAPQERRPRNHEMPGSIGLRQRIVSTYARFARRGSRERDMFMIGTVLPVVDEFALQLRFRQVPQFWDSVAPVRVPVDWVQRAWTVDTEARTTFERLALSVLPKQLPVVYLEGYGELREQVKRLPWPKKPALIFSAAGFWDDTVSTAYGAEKVSSGTRLAHGQHGGGYGVAKFSWPEEHEVAISDRFLTWGWGDDSRPKIKAVGMWRRQRERTGSPNERTTLLLVIWDAWRYSNWLASSMWLFYPKYNEESLSFGAAIPATIRAKLIVRHNATDLGWNQSERWQDRFPDVPRDAGASSMNALLLAARISVYTYNSTGFMEAFLRDVPSVLFWDPQLNPLRESAIPYFEELKAVGILHDSAASAARHVAEVWEDVEKWWRDPPVRRAVERFTARYCFAADDILDRLENALRSVKSDRSTHDLPTSESGTAAHPR